MYLLGTKNLNYEKLLSLFFYIVRLANLIVQINTSCKAYFYNIFLILPAYFVSLCTNVKSLQRTLVLQFFQIKYT